MTPKEMKQLRYLNGEIKMLERQKRSLENMLCNLSATKDIVQGSDAFFPFVLHNRKVEGIAIKQRSEWLKCKADLERVNNRISESCQKIIKEYNRLSLYIENCNDSLTRQILSLYYIEGYTWDQVAARVGGGNTEDTVKKIAYRYLLKQ